MSDENKKLINENKNEEELQKAGSDDVNQEQNEKPYANSPHVNSDEEKEELEKIATLFEQEYKKAKEQLGNLKDEAEQEEADSAWDESSHEYPLPQEVSEDELCLYCFEKPIDFEFSENNEACADCRSKLSRFPLSIKSFVAIFVIVLALLLSGFQGLGGFFNDVQIAQADKLDRAGLIEDSAKIYFELNGNLPQKNTVYENYFYSPLRVKRKTIELLELVGQPNLIAQVYETMPEYALLLPKYKHLTVLKEQADSFVNSLQGAYMVIEDYVHLSGEDFPYDEVIFALNELLLFSDDEPYPNHRKAGVLYYQYNSSILANKELKEQVAYLEEIEQLLPDTLWLYAEYLGYGYARLAEYEKAFDIAKKMKTQNSNNTAPYAIEAAVYRMQQNYEKAMQSCDIGQQVNPQNSYELVRQKAIILLLDNKASEAVAELKEVASIKQSLLNYDTLAICALAAKDSETYDEIASLYEGINAQQGLQAGEPGSLDFSQSVYDYKDGKLSLEEIFLTGRADVF